MKHSRFYMPRNKLFNEAEVLDKAIHLFWKKGYSATSIQDLVSHLGINRASLYDTYGDKEKLFQKAFEHYRDINTKSFIHFLQNEPDVKPGLKKLFERAVDECICDKEKKGCFVVNTTTELIPGDEKIVRMLEENKKTYENLFLEYLKKGEAQGEFQGKDLKAIASLLFTLYSGIKVVSKIQTDKNEMMNTVNLALTLLD